MYDSTGLLRVNMKCRVLVDKGRTAYIFNSDAINQK
jgi:hypothetical protein